MHAFPTGFVYRSMPSSFKGVYGKIVYMFEAKMSRSWWWPSKVKKKINLISKTFQQFWEVMVNTALTCAINVIFPKCFVKKLTLKITRIKLSTCLSMWSVIASTIWYSE